MSFLLALDDTIWSYYAFTYAVNMIKETGNKDLLYILNVIEPIGLTMQVQLSNNVKQELSKKSEERSRQILSFYGSEARKLGISFKLISAHTEKSPTPRIVNAAKTYKVRGIIVGGGGPRNLRMGGSVARNVFERAPHNVTIVKQPSNGDDKMTEEGLHSLLDVEVPEEHFKEKRESDNFIHFQPVEDWLAKMSRAAILDISRPELVPDLTTQTEGSNKSRDLSESIKPAPKGRISGVRGSAKSKRNRNKLKDKNIPQQQQQPQQQSQEQQPQQSQEQQPQQSQEQQQSQLIQKSEETPISQEGNQASSLDRTDEDKNQKAQQTTESQPASLAGDVAPNFTPSSKTENETVLNKVPDLSTSTDMDISMVETPTIKNEAAQKDQGEGLQEDPVKESIGV